MNRFLVVLNAINGILFIAIGLLWVISPYEAGANFGILEISEGLGRSSLIGDVGSYLRRLIARCRAGIDDVYFPCFTGPLQLPLKVFSVIFIRFHTFCKTHCSSQNVGRKTTSFVLQY